jgi:hypothetical protein
MSAIVQRTMWRDENKVGFNRVDLEKLAAWLEERAG